MLPVLWITNKLSPQVRKKTNVKDIDTDG